MSGQAIKPEETEWISKFASADPNRSRSYARYDWYATYIAALFEVDKTQIPGRIAEAERILAYREWQLFTSEADANERSAVIAALHALAALRSCLGVKQHLPTRAA